MASVPSSSIPEIRTEMVPTDFVGASPVDVTLIKDGVAREYTYFPVSCSDFLLFAGVPEDEIGLLNVPIDTRLSDNMMIDVTTSRTFEYTVAEVIPCSYDYIGIDTIPEGDVNVIQPGVDGIKNVTYTVHLYNGEVTERTVKHEDVISCPINGTAELGVGGTVYANDGTAYHYSYVKPMEATAYTYVPGKTTMTTATGRTLAKGIVAVDPKVIPLHTKMFIKSDTWEYGYGEAEDTGGVIKGDIVDLAYMSYDECIQFGRRQMRVYILPD